MADTIREQIIKSLVDQLKTIKKDNGYNTDVGQDVLRAVTPLDNEVPCSSVWPGAEESTKYYSKVLNSMPIRIEGLVRVIDEDFPEPRKYWLSEFNPSVLSEQVLGDLIKCLLGSEWSSLLNSIVYGSGGTDAYPKPGEEITGAFVALVITYNTVKGDPYTQ